MVLDKNFKEFIALLNANEVKYLLIGGYAVALHGHPRYTQDIDFWIWTNKDNAIKVLKALHEFGFGTLPIDESDFISPSNVIQLGYPPLRIDLTMSISACIYFRQLLLLRCLHFVLTLLCLSQVFRILNKRLKIVLK